MLLDGMQRVDNVVIGWVNDSACFKRRWRLPPLCLSSPNYLFILLFLDECSCTSCLSVCLSVSVLWQLSWWDGTSRSLWFLEVWLRLIWMIF